MKTCKICDQKHHAKGYCKAHYREHVMVPNKAKQVCSINGCNNSIGKNGYSSLCAKHYSRKRRHGDPLTTTRFRQYHSLKEFIANADAKEILEHVFQDRAQWSYAVKLYYGDKCSECGWNEVTCDADHIIPHEQGGSNTIANGQVLCPNHHAVKHRNLPMCQRTGITS